MKKVILLFFFIFLHSQTIEVVSNNKNFNFALNSIPKKYYINANIKAPYDIKKHLYTGITLKTFVKIIDPRATSVTFIAYDDYKVTFNKKEINKPYILLVFLEDKKPIPISKRGPAKIIYIKKDNPNCIFKSIFLIKKAIFE